MKRITICFLLLSICVSSALFAQSAPIQVSVDNRKRDRTYALEQDGDLVVAQNPDNASDIVSCFEHGVSYYFNEDALYDAFVYDISASTINCAKSSDSGTSWVQVPLATLASYKKGRFKSYSSPSLVWSKDGALYLALRALRKNNTRTIVLLKSTDKGATFSSPTEIFSATTTNASNIYWPTLAVDNESSSPYYGKLYLAYSFIVPSTGVSRLYLSKSGDGGSTWQTPILVSESETTKYTNYHNQRAALAVASDGGLDAIWVRVDGNTYTSYVPMIVASRSTDGGATWATPTVIDYAADYSTNVKTNESSPIVYLANTSNTAYAAYLVDTGGKNKIKLVSQSRTGGSWSSGVTLELPAGTSSCFNPSISGDGDRNIVVGFQCSSGKKLQSYFAKSSDGGLTFSAPSAVFSSVSLLSNMATVERVFTNFRSLPYVGMHTKLVKIGASYGFFATGAYFKSKAKRSKKQADVVYAVLY